MRQKIEYERSFKPEIKHRVINSNKTTFTKNPKLQTMIKTNRLNTLIAITAAFAVISSFTTRDAMWSAAKEVVSAAIPVTSNNHVGEVASVDFYVNGFGETAKQVTLKVGKKYTLKSVIGNICMKVEYNWLIWGATPTVPSKTTANPVVVFKKAGTYSTELNLVTYHVGGGSTCSSNGSKKKVNYIKVIK